MTLSEYDKEWCTKMHNELNKWTITQPFRFPVDPVRDGAEKYHEIVKNPMDLDTMKKKLASNQYVTVEDYVTDVHLICDNAIKFNGDNSMYAFIAADVKNWIDEQFKNKAISHEEEWHKKLEDVVNRLKEHVKKCPPNISAQTATENLRIP